MLRHWPGVKRFLGRKCQSFTIGRHGEGADLAVKMAQLSCFAAVQVHEPDLRRGLAIGRVPEERQRGAIGADMRTVFAELGVRQLQLLAAIVANHPDIALIAITAGIRRAERVEHPTAVW